MAGDRIKSSYEIAMEKANKISQETSEEEEKKLDIRNELKPILAEYYRDELDPEGLWQELEDYEDDHLVEAQKMIVGSLGLRTSDEEYRKRKKALLAIESLKSSKNTSGIERTLGKIRKLQERYKNEREKLENQLKRETEQRSEMQMKPVQTEDGRTVMKLESGIDQETKQKYNQAISNLENRSDKQFSQLINELRNKIS